MLRNAVVAAAVILAAPARAEDDVARVRVEVGKTVEREVGYAIGVRCDDPEIVGAQMRTKTEQTNVLVLTGRRVGHTLCRAGTDPAGPSMLLEVHVVARRSGRGR